MIVLFCYAYTETSKCWAETMIHSWHFIYSMRLNSINNTATADGTSGVRFKLLTQFFFSILFWIRIVLFHYFQFVDATVSKISSSPIHWLMLIYANYRRCNASKSTFDNNFVNCLDQFQLSHIFLLPLPHWRRIQASLSLPYSESSQHPLCYSSPGNQNEKKGNNVYFTQIRVVESADLNHLPSF